MLNTLPEIINNLNNPYIALAESIRDKEQNSSLINLLSFIKSNTKENINEEMFFVEHSKNSYYNRNDTMNILSNNIIEIIGSIPYSSTYSWRNNKPNEIFNLLESLNFDFTKETKIWSIPANNIEEFIDVKNKSDLINKLQELNINFELNDPIFNNVSMQEERNICLLGKAFKQMKKEDFEKRVQKYETLIEAVKQNKINLIKFLIEDCGVNPNITNDNLTTPIMVCNKLSTLELLNNYNIDWFAKNILGKDCISNFTTLSDKEQSKDMVNLAQKRINESVNSNGNNIDKSYIEKRIKQNLLEMVEADRTKKELEDFIKKYRIKDFSDIFDKENNSLAQICLSKQNWARFNIFKNSYNLEHTNQKGEGYLECLFKMERVSYEEQGKRVFTELLQYNVQDKNTNFAFNVMKDDFENERTLSLPKWFLNKQNINWVSSKFVNEDLAKEIVQKFPERFQYYYFNNYNKVQEEDLNVVKFKSLLFLGYMVKHNKQEQLNELPVEKIFTKEKDYLNENKVIYKVKTHNLLNFLAITENIKENELLTGFNLEKLWNKFEQKSVEHLIKAHHNKDDSFIENNREVMLLLLERNSDLFKAILNDDFLTTISSDKELSVKSSYLLLNDDLNSKIKIEKKINKI